MNDDLFGAPSKKGIRETVGYSAKDIEVLEGLEPVRRRPGMYIGGTDEAALHHLAAEMLDNAMDEAVAGHADRIEMRLEPGNFLTVRDNGRGIPVDPHPKFKHLSALEVILTTLHSGGKFSGKAYTTSGGLHGVGASVVNALSDVLQVEVARERTLFKQDYVRGKPKTRLINAGPVTQPPRHHHPLPPRPADLRRPAVHPRPALPPLPLQGLPVPRRRTSAGPAIRRCWTGTTTRRPKRCSTFRAGCATAWRRISLRRRASLRSGPARWTCPPLPMARRPAGWNGPPRGSPTARGSCTPTATPCPPPQGGTHEAVFAPRC